MIDFESRLTALLDDVAESVRPHPDPDSVFVPTVTPGPVDTHRFRPTFVAVAAAGIVLLGGTAFAMERLTSDMPSGVIPAGPSVTQPSDERSDTPATDSPASVGLTGTPPATTTKPASTSTTNSTPLKDLAIASETKSVIKPIMVPGPTVSAAGPVTGPVTGPSEPAVPAVEPTVPPTQPPATPVVIEFTAKLGADGLALNPMQQGFYGTAQPGSVIRLASQYGVAETTANGEGKWETTLRMPEVPPGTKVAVRITSSTTAKVREFTLRRPGEPTPPVTIEFTANLGLDGQANTPMTQGFFGTAQPGSAIRIASEWGVAETVAGPEGNWEATLVMPEVPPGTKVGVRITSNTTDKVREFTLKRPGEPTPAPIAFTAEAALTTTDHTPPVNEYWGKSTPGALISITSEYGSTQVEANADGKWSARLEFASAPLGVTFNVHITSSKGEAVYDFPLTAVGPT